MSNKNEDQRRAEEFAKRLAGGKIKDRDFSGQSQERSPNLSTPPRPRRPNAGNTPSSSGAGQTQERSPNLSRPPKKRMSKKKKT